MNAMQIGQSVPTNPALPSQARHLELNLMPQLELGLRVPESAQETAPASERWTVAIHEAGHAVVAAFYELPITSARVHRNGAGWLNLNRRVLAPLLRGPSRVRCVSGMCVMGYAGYIAERKVCPSAPRYCGVPDVEKNVGWLQKTTPCERKYDRNTGSYRRPTEAEVEMILKCRARRLHFIARRLVPRLFPAIRLVAQALLEQKRLTGDEVEAIAGPMIAKVRTTSLAPRPDPAAGVNRREACGLETGGV
jgi:hypothetical protein